MRKIVFLISLMSVLVLPGQAQNKKINVLVFSKTAGFRHNSIENGIKMITNLASKRNWAVTATEDPSVFAPSTLKKFEVLVFLNPTGDVLNEAQQKAFEDFMNSGKGFVGIHAATDCEYEWPFYGKITGAYFRTHPKAQTATVVFENTSHPGMKAFRGMKEYRTFDEWYSFKENPRARVHVLARLDENSLDEETRKDDTWKMGDHPLIWYQEINQSRSFYTVFGHTPEAFDDPKISEHIADAIDWCARRL